MTVAVFSGGRGPGGQGVQVGEVELSNQVHISM